MNLQSMNDLYLHELRDVYNAETRLIEVLPRMADKASSPRLRETIENHLEQSTRQRERLEGIFAGLDAAPTGEKCEAMEGLVVEAMQIVTADGNDAAIDAGLIAMANRIEHYRIAAYGAARTHASNLGRDQDSERLDQTLKEIRLSDEKLTDLAVRELNSAACEAC